MPPVLAPTVPAQLTRVFALVVGAFAYRGRRLFESLLFCTCILVGAAPSSANQYLAIAVPLASAFRNPFIVCYNLLGSIHLLSEDKGGLGIETVRSIFPAGLGSICVLSWLLVAALFWLSWRQRILGLVHRAWEEIRLGFD
jgi:hypothetical protein